ncbi:DNA cytosine methyltransferase [Defluviitalea phaphyphila]|uniref:DNA cytosine methyltransferase n=1 Tax=Defluviitalea phaphyphila TaxID=1473580 RepID=UPI000A004CCA|nr:DNA (cytosine-5-)-methyltransferase [Defluviitalea phaphyphila]
MKQLSIFDYVNDKENKKENTLESVNNINKIREKNKRIKILSLFSGCGGMDIGFEGGFTCLKRSINTDIHPNWIAKDFGEWVKVIDTGFDIVFANDIRPEAKAAWVSYFKKRYENPDKIYHLDSIVNLVKRAKEGEKIFPDSIDIIIGGFPCQDFSIAGKRLGFNSYKSHDGRKIRINEPTITNRGKLYMWMREVITITKPLMFIAENVKGLINLHKVKEVIEKDFANAGDGGYLVLPARVLHSADYGVPQSRERVIFYGFKKSALKLRALKELTKDTISKEYDPYPEKTHAYTVKDKKLYPFVTVREAFSGLLEPELTDDLCQKKYSKAKFMGKHCQGQTEVKLDSIAPTIRAEHHGNIEFRRLSLENGGCNIEELKKGLPERRLTIRECARLQTFPDDYQFILPKTKKNVSVSASNAYKLIGNAVPCVLAFNIAMNLAEKWEKYF